jgi:hypothetical protein
LPPPAPVDRRSTPPLCSSASVAARGPGTAVALRRTGQCQCSL